MYMQKTQANTEMVSKNSEYSPIQKCTPNTEITTAYKKTSNTTNQKSHHKTRKTQPNTVKPYKHKKTQPHKRLQDAKNKMKIKGCKMHNKMQLSNKTKKRFQGTLRTDTHVSRLPPFEAHGAGK